MASLLKKHLSNEALRGRLQVIDCVSDLVRRSRLRWFCGHVVRKRDDQQWVRKCMDLRWMAVLVGVGLRKSWLECVNDDMKKLGLKKKRWHTIGPCGGRLFMGKSELCKHEKCDVKWIDRYIDR